MGIVALKKVRLRTVYALFARIILIFRDADKTKKLSPYRELSHENWLSDFIPIPYLCGYKDIIIRGSQQDKIIFRKMMAFLRDISWGQTSCGAA